ncbi:MAG: DUF1651 domain-containing protein [Synechococcus sp.]|nr:DUF1651 domain-containing protein [Synechococcus sp.]
MLIAKPISRRRGIISSTSPLASYSAIRAYSYVPPRPPEPMTRRRMLRHNAIEAWQTMQKTGWRSCAPPVC